MGKRTRLIIAGASAAFAVLLVRSTVRWWAVSPVLLSHDWYSVASVVPVQAALEVAPTDGLDEYSLGYATFKWSQRKPGRLSRRTGAIQFRTLDHEVGFFSPAVPETYKQWFEEVDAFRKGVPAPMRPTDRLPRPRFGDESALLIEVARDSAGTCPARLLPMLLMTRSEFQTYREHLVAKALVSETNTREILLYNSPYTFGVVCRLKGGSARISLVTRDRSISQTVVFGPCPSFTGGLSEEFKIFLSTYRFSVGTAPSRTDVAHLVKLAGIPEEGQLPEDSNSQ